MQHNNLRLNFTLKRLKISSPNYVAVKCGRSRYNKDISFLIIYTSYDNFEKKWWPQETD